MEIDAWAIAVLSNGLGRYGDALTAARGITWQLPIFGNFALSELIEAAVRTGEAALGNDALRQLSFETLAGSDWAAGIESRGRALVSSGDAAEDAYKESIGCLPVRRCVRSSPAPISSTESGCVARIVASTRANTCAPPTRCSRRWAPTPSPRGRERAPRHG